MSLATYQDDIRTERTDLELAREFAKAKMIPEQYKGSAGDCFIALKLARRFGMDAWSLMQELYIVQGRPMMSGKLALAILNHSLAQPLRPTYAGEGDERTITLTGRPEGDPDPLSVTVKVRDAKTTNEQWKKNPDQMLMYFAARMWGRRYTPDILLGIVFDDEEFTEDAPAPQLARKPLTQIEQPSNDAPPEVVGDQGEILDEPVELPWNPDMRWYDWGHRFVSCVRTARDVATVTAWQEVNKDTLDRCFEQAPKVSGNISKAVTEYNLSLVQGEAGQ